jgi:hypothetical protein
VESSRAGARIGARDGRMARARSQEQISEADGGWPLLQQLPQALSPGRESFALTQSPKR